MLYYWKGLLYSLGSVGLLYLTLRYFIRTKIFLVPYFLVYMLFHKPGEPLHATAGGSPYLVAHLWFWLWAMIVFAATFLIYLRRA